VIAKRWINGVAIRLSISPGDAATAVEVVKMLPKTVQVVPISSAVAIGTDRSGQSKAKITKASAAPPAQATMRRDSGGAAMRAR
jgi:hypothetical protein